MVWLGKFYMDFAWAVWPSVRDEGLGACFKFWTVVDSLNLVYSLFITFWPLNFPLPFVVFLMFKSDLNDRIYRIPASIRFVCFK